MPDTLCVIHGTPMTQFWKKEDTNHTGQSWFSHKLEDGTWCNGKPKPARSANGFTQPAKFQSTNIPVQGYNGRPQEYWDKKSKIIALCGLTNAMLNAGAKPEEIDMSKLSTLLGKIESLADFMTKDQEMPF